MKILSAILTMMLFALVVQAQTVSCSKFRNGKFKSETNGISDIIYRNGAHQYEIGIKGKDTLQMGYIVNWVDDCTYTLSADSATMKKYPKIPKNMLITVKMTDPKENSYTQTESNNISSKIFTSEMVLLPNNR